MHNINKLIIDTKLSEEEINELVKDMEKHGVFTLPNNEVIVNLAQKNLYDTVVKFMKEQDITCEETIYQTDQVIENAYDFITDLFNIVKDDLDIEEED